MLPNNISIIILLSNLSRYDSAASKTFDRYDTARDKTFDRYDSAASKTFDRYDTARDKTFDTCEDSTSLGQASSSAMYFSACESLHDDEQELPSTIHQYPLHVDAPFYYEDSLRSLVLFEADSSQAHDRTRTPTIETNDEQHPTPQPSPKMAVKFRTKPNNQEEKTAEKSRNSVVTAFANGVRRARSLKLALRDKAPAQKKYSAVNPEIEG